MNRKKQLAAVLYQLVLAALAAVGVLAECGIFKGRSDFGTLQLYVVGANAICALFFFCSFVYGLFSNRAFLPRVRGAVIMLLFVSVILDGAVWRDSLRTDMLFLLLHFVVPGLALLDWLIFETKRKYRWISPVLWMILPNLYFLYVILRAKLFDAGWLYGFLNPELHGMGKVALTVLTVNLFSFALGYLFVSLDQLTVKRKKPRKKRKKS